MSLDSLQSLLTMNTEYLNCLELVNGKLQINKQSYAELLAAEYAEAAATILSNAQHEVANLTEILQKSKDLYKNRLEYLLPFDTGLTSEAGDIEFQLTFVHVEMDSEGQTIQRVRKAGPGVVHIIPISKWSDLIPDEALSTLDQRIIALEALNKAMTDRFNTSLANKADNITYDEEHRIQLTSEGKPIGNAIKITTETVETEDGSMRVVPF